MWLKNRGKVRYRTFQLRPRRLAGADLRGAEEGEQGAGEARAAARKEHRDEARPRAEAVHFRTPRQTAARELESPSTRAA